jgi:hypothetical protein
MARRILSADAALVPHSQAPLRHGVRPANGSNGSGAVPAQGSTVGPALFGAIQARWLERSLGAMPPALFDWQDQRPMLDEIAFVNRAQGLLDEASVKIAPSVLRIVLTVKANVPDAAGQRAFLAEHLALDFRRLSELCIVADSYGLLDLTARMEGEKEISRYGWSKALKLAHVRDPLERREIWRRACAHAGADANGGGGGSESASYRSVLEEIRRFRERKQIGPLTGKGLNGAFDLAPTLTSARLAFAHLDRTLRNDQSRGTCADALDQVNRLRRDLETLKRALQERLEMMPMEAMAEELAREA